MAEWVVSAEDPMPSGWPSAFFERVLVRSDGGRKYSNGRWAVIGLRKTDWGIFTCLKNNRKQELQAKNTAPSERPNQGRLLWWGASNQKWANAWEESNYSSWMTWTCSSITCARAIAKRAESRTCGILPWFFVTFFIKKKVDRVFREDVYSIHFLSFACPKDSGKLITAKLYCLGR